MKKSEDRYFYLENIAGNEVGIDFADQDTKTF